MKRTFLVFAILLLMVGVSSAADTSGIAINKATGSVTLDSAYDVAWEVIDSFIVTAPETSAVSFSITGIARLDPGDQFWIGFCNDSISVADSLAYAASRNMDSIQIQGLGRWARGRIDMSFFVATVDTIARGITDTIYITGACGGSAGIEQVELSNVVIQAIVGAITYP